jgi:hypothetical protein
MDADKFSNPVRIGENQEKINAKGVDDAKGAKGLNIFTTCVSCVLRAFYV